MAAKFDVAVKGDPKTGKLGDCPYSQRALLTLAVKGLEYSMTPIDFASKPEWVVKASGGKVPILRSEEKGLVMPDSDVIVEYLEKEFPQPSMKSKAPADLGNSFFPTLTPFLKAAAGSAEEAEAKGKMEAELRSIQDFLAAQGNGPLIGGSSVDAKDAALAPKLYHACVASKAIKGYDIQAHYPAIQKYFATLACMPHWKQTLPTDGDAVIVDGWRKKISGQGH